VLYFAALFLVDNGFEVYLWQGWWPAQDLEDGTASVRTGSTEARFITNRKCAMQTTIHYCQGETMRHLSFYQKKVTSGVVGVVSCP